MEAATRELTNRIEQQPGIGPEHDLAANVVNRICAAPSLVRETLRELGSGFVNSRFGDLRGRQKPSDQEIVQLVDRVVTLIPPADDVHRRLRLESAVGNL